MRDRNGRGRLFLSGRDLATCGQVHGSRRDLASDVEEKKKKKIERTQERVGTTQYRASPARPPHRCSGSPVSPASAPPRFIIGRCAPPPPLCLCSRHGRAAGPHGSPASRRRFGSTPPARAVGRRRSLQSRCTNCSCCWRTPAGSRRPGGLRCRAATRHYPPPECPRNIQLGKQQRKE